jgi:hypothetical protein
VIRIMQERLERRDAENQRLADLVDELRTQVEIANRRLERAQAPAT